MNEKIRERERDSQGCHQDECIKEYCSNCKFGVNYLGNQSWQMQMVKFEG